MDAEAAVGVVGACLTTVGVVVAYLQLRRTPRASALTQQPSRSGPGAQLVIGDIPREPLAHIRREGLLASLERTAASGKLCSLVGGRGVGKTHLAATYARDRLAQNYACLVWIVADDAAAVVTALAEVAKQAGVTDDVVDTEPAAKAALRWLEQLRAPALIVLDNAVAPDVVTPWLPQRGNVEVVITTTMHEFAVLGAELRVDVFTPEQAAAFLCARAGRDDLTGAALVASKLGQLPLALAQAGAVIRGRRLSFAEYLDGFPFMPLGSSLPRVPGEGYPFSLEQTTLRSIAEAENGGSGSLVAQIIDLMAVLSEVGVSRTLLHQLPAERADVDAALGALANASLVGFDVNGAVVAMHRLTRQVAVQRLHREGRLQPVASQAVAILNAVTNSEPAPGIDVIDHITELWAQARVVAGSVDELLRDLLSLRRWSVQRLSDMGEFAKAVATGLAVLADHQAELPADHASTVEARSCLIGAYLEAEREAEAVPFAERALADCVRRVGPDHPSTVRARNRLGYCCECAGHLDRALEIHQFNLEESLRVCGPDAPVTMGARINLASTYRSVGRLATAVPLFEENLQENTRAFGLDHPSTINARGELARIYVRTGRAEEAIELHEMNATLLQDKPEDTGFAWWPQYRAVAYSAAGRHREAIVMLRSVLRRSKRVMPRDNPRTIRLRLFLARALLAAGHRREALRLFEQVVADRERVLGTDHPASLNARRNLALALAVCGRRRRARRLIIAVLADYRRVLGTEHPYTRTAQANLVELSSAREFPL
ncbi:FxSxx-COOH system tetratricopeptide repeat protein [Micromonospora mangrovi]|uniref:FxSxx-COOH system tetratricopeptide repeat protein n=2 Tax=Micromonospora TaxID=1873 RepID=A0AAU7MB47_9ACTN